MIPVFIPWPTNFDWVAIGAVATFGAVAVALWPIIAEHMRRRAMARTLRARCLAVLSVIRASLDVLCRPPSGAPTSPAALVANPLEKSARQLEALVAQAHILDPTGHDRLVALHLNLNTLTFMEAVSPDAACRLLVLTNDAMKALDRGGYRKGKPDLSWQKPRQ